jgi:hypothetical protein
MRRIMLVAAALSIPLAASTAGLVALSGPAGASAPVSCSKVTGTTTGTLTFKGCGGGLGKGTGPAAALAGTGTITWKGHHKGTTTITITSVTNPAVSRCATGSTEFDATGSVTGDTSGKVTVGSPVSGDACVTAAGAVTLVKHTVFTLQP